MDIAPEFEGDEKGETNELGNYHHPFNHSNNILETISHRSSHVFNSNSNNPNHNSDFDRDAAEVDQSTAGNANDNDEDGEMHQFMEVVSTFTGGGSLSFGIGKFGVNE